MVKLFDYFPRELKEKIIEDKINKIKTSSNKDFSFTRVKKLPLDSKRQVLSAINHFFNVKGVTDLELDEAYKKIIQKANFFEICTIAFSKQYEAYKLSPRSKESKSNS